MKNYMDHGGMYNLSRVTDWSTAKYTMSMNAMNYGDDYGRPDTEPPDLPSLLLDARICYLGMAVSLYTMSQCIAFLWLNTSCSFHLLCVIFNPIYLLW